MVLVLVLVQTAPLLFCFRHVDQLPTTDSTLDICHHIVVHSSYSLFSLTAQRFIRRILFVVVLW
jgi:hypothetical protein